MQKITEFASADIPVAVGLVFDDSGSMRSKRPDVITAGLVFIGASNPQDQIFVVNFNDKVRRGLPETVPFTDDIKLLRSALSRDMAEGQTALYDAIALSLDHLQSGRRDKKTLVVVSDGGDNVSKHTLKELMQLVQESRATIYTIGIFAPDDPDRNPQVLERIARVKVLLLQRFPNATADELTAAHAYAYCGSIIQDLGYYPFSSKFFSDLTHYVRSGDFVASLIRNSQDLNEYAFSLGALAHYAADNNGHRIATNLAVPLLYPKLRLKFGNLVTYADDPFSHLKTEFGFDVFQAAKGRYAPDGYKGFVGFEVAKPVLERAFEETYGMRIEHVFASFDLAIGSYRRTVSSILPAMTRVAWQIKKQEIRKDAPGTTRTKFLYNISRSSYEKNWGTTYPRPGRRSQVLAFFFRVVPRIGPFKALAFKRLTPATEKIFMASFNAWLDRYRELLAGLKADRLQLPNQNFDTGELTQAGQYKLTDAAYAKLLDKLADHYADLSPELRGDILAFYNNLAAPISTKTNDKEWATLLKELDALKAADLHVVAEQ